MAQPFVFSYTLLDTNGVKTAHDVNYMLTDPDTTWPDIVTDWTTYGGLLNAATNAKIVGGKVSRQIPKDDTWKAAAVQENDVSDVIDITFDNADNLRSTLVALQNHKDAQVVSGKVLVTETALAALIAALIAPSASGYFTSDTGEALTARRAAFLADRKHRRQLRNKTGNFV